MSLHLLPKFKRHRDVAPEPDQMSELLVQMRAELARADRENRDWWEAAGHSEVFALAAVNERLTPDTAFDPYRVRISPAVLAATGLDGERPTDCWDARPMPVDVAHQVMQLHRECDRKICRRRMAARDVLQAAGHLKPAA